MLTPAEIDEAVEIASFWVGSEYWLDELGPERIQAVKVLLAAVAEAEVAIEKLQERNADLSAMMNVVNLITPEAARETVETVALIERLAEVKNLRVIHDGLGWWVDTEDTGCTDFQPTLLAALRALVAAIDVQADGGTS